MPDEFNLAQTFTDAVVSVADPLREEVARLQAECLTYRRALERIADVAERYQESQASLACAGLSNCYRFATAALARKTERAA